MNKETILKIEELTDFSIGDNNELDGFVITTDEQVIKFGIDNEQSCCESWGILSTVDNIQEFLGARLLKVEITDTCLNKTLFSEESGHDLDEDTDYSDLDVMFVDLVTDRGILQFTAYNCHNGYYGHGVYLQSNQLSESTSL